MISIFVVIPFRDELLESLFAMVEPRKLERHEFAEVSELVQFDRNLAMGDVETILEEAAHRIAFRNGLGNALICSEPAGNQLTLEGLADFFALTSKKMNLISVYGIAHQKLIEGLNRLSEFKEGSLNEPAAKYFGGEERIEADTSLNHVLLVSKAPGMKDISRYWIFQVFKSLWGPSSSIKYSNGSTTFISDILRSELNEKSIFNLSSFATFHSDAGLMGLRASTDRSTNMTELLNTVIKSIWSKCGAKPVTLEELQAAKNRVLFEYASKFDNRFSALQSMVLQVSPLKVIDCTFV